MEMQADNKSFITKVLTIVGAVILVLAIVAGGKCAMDAHAEHEKQVAEQKKQAEHEQAQAYIRDMVALCGFSHLTDDEQKKIDDGKDDPEQVRYALNRIIDDRVIYWKNMMTDLEDSFQKLQGIKQSYAYSWDEALEHTYQGKAGDLLASYKEAKNQKEVWEDTRLRLKNWTPVQAAKRIQGQNNKPDPNSL